jgi:hypothetical protein
MRCSNTTESERRRRCANIALVTLSVWPWGGERLCPAIRPKNAIMKGGPGEARGASSLHYRRLLCLGSALAGSFVVLAELLRLPARIPSLPLSQLAEN